MSRKTHWGHHGLCDMDLGIYTEAGVKVNMCNGNVEQRELFNEITDFVDQNTHLSKRLKPTIPKKEC